ncbi:unnamed protein product, partial [Adineta steineri]
GVESEINVDSLFGSSIIGTNFCKFDGAFLSAELRRELELIDFYGNE